MNIKELYRLRKLGSGGAGHQDMVPHMDGLRNLAAMCYHCTEFGVRTGQSTVAMACGMAENRGGILRSFDLNEPQFDWQVPATIDWEFTKADTSKLETIEETDLLFIDTLHNTDQVRAELKLAPFVKRFLVFHDVQMFGTVGEQGGGISQAIWEFLAETRQWRVREYEHSTWGMLTLERL